MKRFAPLALIVFALAAVPAAFADDGGTPAAPTTSAPARQHDNDSNRPVRVEILRLRLQIVSLRFRRHCGPNGKASQERCVAFAQKVVARLTTLDGNVQKKLAALAACSTDSTATACQNAERKITVLAGVDTHLKNAIQKVQDWLNGKSSDSTSSDDSLDQAASALAGSTG